MVSTDELMALVGTEIAKMHLAEVIHGDLTTSNMMVRTTDIGGEAKAQVVRLAL